MYKHVLWAQRHFHVLWAQRHFLVLCISFFLVTSTSLTSAQNVNEQCGLIVPANPLTLEGLISPYYLVALNPSQGPCSMSIPVQQAFVNALILDLETGTFYNYNPLVIDNGTEPALPIVTPNLPANFMVGLFIGSNTNAYGNNSFTLTLLSAPNGDSLLQGNCLQGTLIGINPDLFGQFATCNTVQLYSVIDQMIREDIITVPPIGTGYNGLPCPTVRSFDLVDNTQSDTVPTYYLLNPDGTVAQYNPDYVSRLPNAQQIDNFSDAYLAILMDTPLGCSPWLIQDLTDPSGMSFVSNLGTSELQANYKQGYPMALVPALDPDVVEAVNEGNSMYNGYPDLLKLNAYRLSVDQPPITYLSEANVTFYCQALATVASYRLQSAQPYYEKVASPDATMGDSFFTFMVARFIQTYGPGYNGFNCKVVLGVPCPMSCSYDSDGVCTAASITPIDLLGIYTTSPSTSPTPTSTTPTSTTPTSTTPTASSATSSCSSEQSTVVGLAITLAIVLAFDVIVFLALVLRRSRPQPFVDEK